MHTNRLLIIICCFVTLLLSFSTFASGACIRGNCVNGYGTYTWPDGQKYVGEFKDDKSNGQGTLTSPNGQKYVGNYTDGNFNGQGTLTSPNGRKYVGNFTDGKPNGQGTLTSPNGQKYVGNYKDDKKHGQGTHTSPEGQKYVGEFTDDKKHGQGTHTSPEGQKYVGEFTDGNFNGQGTLTSPNGQKYVGNYTDGNFNGQGTLTSPDGQKYVGNFTDDKKHGQGTLTSPDGSQWAGEWRNNEKYQEDASVSIAEDQHRPAGKRFALVIGNSQYSALGILRNPRNDARDIAAALQRLGFTVTVHIDTTKRAMKDVIRTFGRQLRQAGANRTGLFYFAGHGMQVKGENYLLPIGVDIREAYEVEDEGITVARVLAAMEDEVMNLQTPPTNILILDACRNNPIARRTRAGTRGLARIQQEGGTYIAFAAAPGQVAADGSGKNGTYTKHLLRHIEQPGRAIGSLFTQVRRDVYQETQGAQVPWTTNGLLGEFYFAR